MNAKKVKEAAARAFEKLSKLSEEDFRRQLEVHADGDIAKALLDLDYFQVGQTESEAFEFGVNEVPNSPIAWHEITHFNAVNLESSLVLAADQWLVETPGLIQSWKDAVYWYNAKLIDTMLSDFHSGETNFDFVGKFPDWMDANVGVDSFVMTYSASDENQEQEPWRLAA